MKSRTRSPRALKLALAAVGTLLVSGAVFAADDEVVIQSAGATLMHRSPYASEQLVSITRSVRYGDLDLVSHSGVQTLEGRINDTAASICEKLEQLYGTPGFDQRQCVRDAVRGAMVQARAAITAAERRMHTAQLTSR